MKGFFKVVSCGELMYVRSDKSANGQLAKRSMVLQGFGGKFEDQYLVTLLGNDAQCTFYPNEFVVASLRCTVREFNNQQYQDVTVQEVQKLMVNA